MLVDSSAVGDIRLPDMGSDKEALEGVPIAGVVE